ncbi:hypothetical protein TSACC_3672 [Terrimicrobium sacchariphilum]|uniref:Uncharacterized protein n=1 Tax=Terrimicrobium sacchariphilum TaxID=690879 RepID=A0A146GE50_TERSA|nr:Asp23/Gls24 family envelope stress response protein [Terrimicrobium sacchariphilum]GAT35601.1 hypothetical protein TSACC_3672 [Terrimicrobium sacchariphilum]
METFSFQCYLSVTQLFKKTGLGTHFQNGKPTLAVSKNPPTTGPNTVAIRLNLELPVGLFMKPQLEASIRIPDGPAPEITAEVQENIAKAIREASGINVNIKVEGPENVE